MWIQFIVVNGRITKSPNNIISLIYICISVYSWSLSPNICVARLLIGCFDCFGILPQLRIRRANCMAGICFWTSKERSCPNYCPKRLMNENKVLLGCLKPYSEDCYFFITQKRTSFNYLTLTILFRYQEHTFLFKVWQKIQLQLTFQIFGKLPQCIICGHIGLICYIVHAIKLEYTHTIHQLWSYQYKITFVLCDLNSTASN